MALGTNVILVIALVVLLALIFLRMEIAFAMGIVTYLWLIAAEESILTGFQRLFGGLDNFTLLAIPFFLLAGELMNKSEITNELIQIANLTIGRVKGGLAQANILASLLFAGITGAALADVAALGSILVPAMEEEGYDTDFSAALTAASSLVGPIIPPSIIIVLYGAITNTSIGGLFVAAIGPGLLLGVTLMLQVAYFARRDDMPRYETSIDRSNVPSLLGKAALAMTMPIIILGGIVGGVFTPTEAAAVACVYAVIIGMFIFGTLSLQGIYDSLESSVLRTSQLFIILGFATMLSYLLAKERIPQNLAAAIMDLGLGPTEFMLLLAVILLFIGTWLDIGAALIIIAPVTVEMATTMGIHPFHFGIMMTVTLLFGLITPPFGACLFVAASVSQTPVWDISKRIVPFYAADVVVLLGIIYVPELTLFLPRAFGFA
ncbi:TRAP transporter large permease subunit [Halorubrum sp. CBA1125]|uniref:TRAP transporter large permease n=1 Tax=Halorubrum sp. CBA1125 TaxID=2668072 RepID=UPI0012E973BB|nr:TRAP transporter large permease [Halorubrum sp. CBA1125]MUW13696.1 TRAP transporter large permease subunit [Halorubrum sp. CBA1125]